MIIEIYEGKGKQPWGFRCIATNGKNTCHGSHNELRNMGLSNRSLRNHFESDDNTYSVAKSLTMNLSKHETLQLHNLIRSNN